MTLDPSMAHLTTNTLSLEQMFMISMSIIGALVTLFLAVLGFVAVKHFKDDVDRNENRKQEIAELKAEHNEVVKSIYQKLGEHDANQNSFRVDVAERMTRLETKMDLALAHEHIG